MQLEYCYLWLEGVLSYHTMAEESGSSMKEMDPISVDTPLTKVMIAVNQSSKGYPNPSISSRQAFEWILKNLIKPCCKKQYKLLILHVQVHDEDGEEQLPCYS